MSNQEEPQQIHPIKQLPNRLKMQKEGENNSNQDVGIRKTHHKMLSSEPNKKSLGYPESMTLHSFNKKQTSDLGSTTSPKNWITGQNFFSTNDLFMHTPGLASSISASTLRHTSPQFSFPKGTRFENGSSQTAVTNLELPSTLTKRSTTQGFGKKIVFQFKFQQVKAESLPSPDRYEVRSIPGKDQLKRSFGAPFEDYAKTYIPANPYIPLDYAKKLPGPGGYNVRQDMGQHRYQYILKGKGKMFNDLRDWGFPGPQEYHPTHKITEQQRFNGVSQGIGKKKDPFRSTSTTPGPGRYMLPSPFDKFDSRRKRQSGSFKIDSLASKIVQEKLH